MKQAEKKKKPFTGSNVRIVDVSKNFPKTEGLAVLLPGNRRKKANLFYKNDK